MHIFLWIELSVVGAGADASAITADRKNQQEIFKNCAPFTNYITKINKIQAENAKDLDDVMPMYILITDK